MFEQEHRILGDDPRIPPGRGKPAPDIFLLALKSINDSLVSRGEPEIKPEECLVFEDSVPGVEAGLRAGMQVVWCPHPGLLREFRGRELDVLTGSTNMDLVKQGQDIATNLENDKGSSQSSESNAPGIYSTGRSRLLETLENFPYESYGIELRDSPS